VALERYDGTGVSPADYEGQPLVMNFWASWCVPCTEEMPDFQQVHESLGEDVAFLGVNVRDDEEAGRAMVERTGVTYDVARDTSGDLARELGITNLPVTVIVAPDGTVLDTLHAQVSPARLCEVVNQQLMGQSLGEGDCG
jgi:thiol-disulfide isomerase/thioredoxin